MSWAAEANVNGDKAHPHSHSCPGMELSIAIVQAFVLEYLDAGPWVVEDEDIMTDASVLFNIPELLIIIENSDSDEYEDDVMLVNDAYKVLSAIIATRVGREAFIASRGMTVLSLLNIRQGFQDEEALELLLDLLTYERDSCWSYYSGLQDLFHLLKKISENYEKLSLVEDLDMIDIVKTILMTIPANNSNPLGPDSLPSPSVSVSGSSGTEPGQQHIGSVIEISPLQSCDKWYLSFLFFDRLERHVNTARVDTESILPLCTASLAGDQGDLGAGCGCGYIYRQFHCYPSASLIDKEIN